MTFPVVWLMPDVPRAHNDSRWRLTWAQSQIEDILTELGGEHTVGFDDVDGGAAVVIPGEYYVDAVDWIGNELDNLDWAVVFITSDERSAFPASKLNDHRLDRMRVWVQTPRPGRYHGDARFLPFGPPPSTRRLLGDLTEPGQGRALDWFFAGQVNHARRRHLVNMLPSTGGKLIITEGFLGGLDRAEYLATLAEAKVIPCPSGPSTPDSFRVWEAFEAGCVPVIDGLCPGYEQSGYWPLTLGSNPDCPVDTDWAPLPRQINRLVAEWPTPANRAGAWWSNFQRDLRRRIRMDLDAVAQRPVCRADDITVLVTTSPIPSHPDTAIIEETVASVRHWLPDAEILVLVDGVREEQAGRAADYAAYQERLLWLARHRWGRCTVIRHEHHQHQANMTRHALDRVDTPLILFMEHDTPLVTDEPMDWDAIKAPLLADELDVMRFHYEGAVPDAHYYRMLDHQAIDMGGCPVMRTRQWSQRPHLARTDLYVRLLDDHFPATCSTMIEDVAHAVVQKYPWRFHRLAVYAPSRRNIKRSLHLNGRGEDPMYDMTVR